MAKIKSKTLVIIKGPVDYSLMAFINTFRKKEEDHIKNIVIYILFTD